jgi:DNA polymerase
MKKISGITQLHGQMQVLTFGNIEVHVFPLFHPAAMMYNPKLRDVLAKDFIGLADALKELK